MFLPWHALEDGFFSFIWLLDDERQFAPAVFLAKLTDAKIWGLGCRTTGDRCGVASNTLLFAILTGDGTTLLGLAFALIVTRTRFRGKRVRRMRTVLPSITPPFVVGLAIILLFGRSGTVTQLVSEFLGIEAAGCPDIPASGSRRCSDRLPPADRCGRRRKPFA